MWSQTVDKDQVLQALADRGKDLGLRSRRGGNPLETRAGERREQRTAWRGHVRV